MKSYRGKFKCYLGNLSRRVPSPGGGSAVSLVFCLGVSLIVKAVNYSFSIEPKGTGERRKNQRLKNALRTFKVLEKKIYPFIDQDGRIFTKILSTKGREKRKFLKKSEGIILVLGEAAVKVFSLAKKTEPDIKKSIISDFKIGEGLMESVLSGCVLNLEANRRIFGRSSTKAKILKRNLRRWGKY